MKLHSNNSVTTHGNQLVSKGRKLHTRESGWARAKRRRGGWGEGGGYRQTETDRQVDTDSRQKDRHYIRQVDTDIKIERKIKKRSVDNPGDVFGH